MATEKTTTTVKTTTLNTTLKGAAVDFTALKVVSTNGKTFLANVIKKAGEIVLEDTMEFQGTFGTNVAVQYVCDANVNALRSLEVNSASGVSVEALTTAQLREAQKVILELEILATDALPKTINASLKHSLKV